MFDFGMPQLDPAQPMGPQIQMPAPKKKGGMFGSGKGNIGEALSAAIFGALAAKGVPTGMMGLQMLHQRRSDAAAREQAGLDRENDFQDFVRKEAYKSAHPGPVNNDTVQDYNFRVQTLGKDAADEWLRNPPQFMNIPGVGLVQVPRSAGQMPSAPVGKLTPIDEGGAGPVAPRPFP